MMAPESMSSPGTLRLEEGEGGDPSGTGPFAVGWKPQEAVGSGPRAFTVDLFYPAEVDASFAYGEAPYPVVILLQGGYVPVADYYYLAERLAGWGYVVALPQYPDDLAANAPLRASITLSYLDRSNGSATFWKGGLDLDQVAVGGHSLGGVMADFALSDPRFNALILLASYPGDDDGASFPGYVIDVGGTYDCAATVGEVETGYYTYGLPRGLALIDGMTHYQFTASDEEDAVDCPPGISLDDAHAHLSGVLVPFLEYWLKGDSSFLPYLTEPEEGVSILLEE
jgi:hypothetical protein